MKLFYFTPKGAITLRFVTKKMRAKQFPALSIENELVQSVKKNPVTVVTAPTGSGKTICLSAVLAEHFARKEGQRVTVTQNKRVLATGASEYVAHLSQKEWGHEIGYRIGGERFRRVKYTRLEFVTTAIITHEILHNEITMTVLVIDEIHEMTSEQILLMALVKRLIAAGNRIRLVLMSATCDASKYAKYFGEANTSIIDVPCPKPYPVERVTVPAKTYGADGMDLRSIVRQVRQAAARGDGDILVFLASKYYVLEVERRLAHFDKVDLRILLGGMTAREEREALAAAAPGTVRVFLSTEVARSGITIPDLKYVISPKVSRIAYYSTEWSTMRLEYTTTDNASLVQEMGRVGRTRPGKAILIDNGFPAEEYAKAQIELDDFSPTLLRLRARGMRPDELDWFVEPPKHLVDAAYSELRMLGAIDRFGGVTEAGKLMSSCPIRPRYAKAIIAGSRLGVGQQVVDIIAETGQTWEARGYFREKASALVDKNPATPTERGEEQAIKLAFIAAFWDMLGLRVSKNDKAYKKLNGNTFDYGKVSVLDSLQDKMTKEIVLPYHAIVINGKLVILKSLDISWDDLAAVPEVEKQLRKLRQDIDTQCPVQRLLAVAAGERRL